MKYDVAVLGAGPGGYETAIRCVKYGLRTVLIEAADLGGTCLNRGCIPTKALLHGAEVYSEVRGAAASGVNVTAPEINFAAMAKRKDMIVQRLRGGIAFLEQSYGVDVIQGFGVLKGPHEIEVNGDVVEAEHIILATGSTPSLPPIPGADREGVVTSDEILSMTQVPESIVIIGGGVIGLEFATLFSGLGVRVTIIEMLPALLPDMDRDIVRTLEKRLKRSGVSIVTNARVLEIASQDTMLSVCYADAEGTEYTACAQMCSICAGRKPSTGNIGLEQVGVACDARGFVLVDDHLRTSVENIYAIGDITGKIQLAHVATAQGCVAAANCAGLEQTMDYSAIPSCIYCVPEIASIGKSARVLNEEGVAFKTGEFRAMSNGRAMTLGETDGMVKIFTAVEDGRILGAQIMAPHASDMIAEIGVVMHFGGTAHDLGQVVHPHPSLSEMIAEAAHDVEGLSCNSMPKN